MRNLILWSTSLLRILTCSTRLEVRRVTSAGEIELTVPSSSVGSLAQPARAPFRMSESN